jgi:hypothetical protein
VQFGWDENQGPLNGTKIIPSTSGLIIGINIEGNQAVGPPGGPMSLTDYGNPGDSVLRIYNQSGWNFGLQITDGVVANLTHGTVVAGGRIDGGYGGLAGIGSAGTLYLQGATITNQSLVGLLAANEVTTVNGCTISGNGCYGVAVGSESTVTGIYPVSSGNQSLFYNNAHWNRYVGPGAVLHLSQSTIKDNFVGLVQDGVGENGFEGLFSDLAQSPDGGPGGNVIACNDRSHGILDATGACTAYANGGPGGNVWNRSDHGISADNVAWGPVLPTLWTCDNLLTPATCFADGGSYCSGPACLGTPLPAVLSPDINGGLGTLSAASATLGATSCP